MIRPARPANLTPGRWFVQHTADQDRAKLEGSRAETLSAAFTMRAGVRARGGRNPDPREEINVYHADMRGIFRIIRFSAYNVMPV
jgi:hypothetical protein